MQLLDSSIWLDHLAGTSEESSIIINNEDLLFCSILSIFEIKKKLIKLRFKGEKLDKSIEFVKQRALIINLNDTIINTAVEYSIKNNLSVVDSLIYATALEIEAQLITADNDFRNLENLRIIKK